MESDNYLYECKESNSMKKILITLCLSFTAWSLMAQATGSIVLNPPETTGGLSVMKALSLRASATGYDTSMLSLQDLSNLLWAANGVNRPESGKRTAPSAMNAQDIDVYVFMKKGVYLYDAQKHVLDLVLPEDHRSLVAGKQLNVAQAPVICLLVSDIARFRHGEDNQKLIWAAEDAGIVSQNISIFCASQGLATRPRASMDQEKLQEILKLKPTQHLMLNAPVSYPVRNQ